jgi:hypothetical protein
VILLVEPDPTSAAAGPGPAGGRRLGRRAGGDVGHELLDRDQLLSRVPGGDFERVSVPVADSDVLRDLVLAENPGTVIEIGLAYGSSALAIAEALVAGGSNAARHVIVDAYQSTSTLLDGLRSPEPGWPVCVLWWRSGGRAPGTRACSPEVTAATASADQPRRWRDVSGGWSWQIAVLTIFPSSSRKRRAYRAHSP